MTYTPTPEQRAKALDALKAGDSAERLHFHTADALYDPASRTVYVAVDDWLPDPDTSEPDPIASEWPAVLEAVAQYGKVPPSLAEPSCDNENRVCMSRIPLG